MPVLYAGKGECYRLRRVYQKHLYDHTIPRYSRKKSPSPGELFPGERRRLFYGGQFVPEI